MDSTAKRVGGSVWPRRNLDTQDIQYTNARGRDKDTLQDRFGNMAMPSARTYNLSDHVGKNTIPLDPATKMAHLDWEKIIQRLWPQELNFFHIDAPTRRRHCFAHYQSEEVSSEEYRFMALQAGLPDNKEAFADAHELGAWTMDLLWTEVINRIERVHAYTKKDDPTHKAKTKENRKGFRVVLQEMFMRLCKQDPEGRNEERLGNYFETEPSRYSSGTCSLSGGCTLRCYQS
eukprot:538925-Amphidinium_carterae.2